ncbi:hypothetical protein Tco_0996966 [Tanacetum coccineum]
MIKRYKEAAVATNRSDGVRVVSSRTHVEPSDVVVLLWFDTRKGVNSSRFGWFMGSVDVTCKELRCCARCLREDEDFVKEL